MTTISQWMRRKLSMNKKRLLTILLFPFILCGCGEAVSDLYEKDAFNTGRFMDNYYLRWNNVDKIQPSKTYNYDATSITTVGVADRVTGRIDGIREEDQKYGNVLLDWDSDRPVADYGIGYGPTKNMTSIDNAFAHGYLSKLYDGRIRCDGYQARSRVQLDSTGYATYFPKELTSYKYFAFFARGGTTCERTFKVFPIFDVNVTFYTHDSATNIYEAHSISMNNLQIRTNDGGLTNIVSFYFDDLFGTGWETKLSHSVAMSFTFHVSNYGEAGYRYDKSDAVPLTDITDTVTDDTKEHKMCLMLYEVMIPDSTWY